MAIKTPDWAIKVGAFPTAKGWEVHRSKGRTELIKAAKFSAAAIAEWHGHAAAEAPVVQTLHEAPHVEREVTHEEITHHYDEHVEHEHHGDHHDHHDTPLHHSGHWEE